MSDLSDLYEPFRDVVRTIEKHANQISDGIIGGRFLTWSGVEDDIRQYLHCPVCGEPNQEPEIDGLADDDEIPF